MEHTMKPTAQGLACICTEIYCWTRRTCAGPLVSHLPVDISTTMQVQTCPVCRTHISSPGRPTVSIIYSVKLPVHL